jgi:hypothetical protein
MRAGYWRCRFSCRYSIGIKHDAKYFRTKLEYCIALDIYSLGSMSSPWGVCCKSRSFCPTAKALSFCFEGPLRDERNDSTHFDAVVNGRGILS